MGGIALHVLYKFTTYLHTYLQRDVDWNIVSCSLPDHRSEAMVLQLHWCERTVMWHHWSCHRLWGQRMCLTSFHSNCFRGQMYDVHVASHGLADAHYFAKFEYYMKNMSGQRWLLEMTGNGFVHFYSFPFPFSQFPFLPIPILNFVTYFQFRGIPMGFPFTSEIPSHDHRYTPLSLSPIWLGLFVAF